MSDERKVTRLCHRKEQKEGPLFPEAFLSRLLLIHKEMRTFSAHDDHGASLRSGVRPLLFPPAPDNP